MPVTANTSQYVGNTVCQFKSMRVGWILQNKGEGFVPTENVNIYSTKKVSYL
jgi:hypothetical protein